MKVRITIDYDTEPPFNRRMVVEPKEVAGNETLMYGILAIARDLVTMKGVRKEIRKILNGGSEIQVVDALGHPKS